MSSLWRQAGVQDGVHGKTVFSTWSVPTTRKRSKDIHQIDFLVMRVHAHAFRFAQRDPDISVFLVPFWGFGILFSISIMKFKWLPSMRRSILGNSGWLVDRGLLINADKCQFVRPDVEYLGHLLSTVGCRPPVTKVTTIQEFPLSTTRGQRRSFRGMVNFDHGFIAHCAKKSALLHSITGTDRLIRRIARSILLFQVIVLDDPAH